MITKKDKYFILLSVLVSFVLLFGFGRGSNAAESAAVAATVTAQSLSVGVSDSTVTYGTLSAGSTQNTLAGNLNDRQKATNDGNVAEDFNIKGINSTSAGIGWTLAATADTNQYFHQVSTNTGVGWTALTLNYQKIANTVGVGSTQWFDLQLGTPSSTTDYLQQTVNVTVQAVTD